MCNVVFFQTTILVVQVHQMIHHQTSSILYEVCNSYFSSSYMFFFPILWCCSSGNQCFFLMWNFTKMQKTFWGLVPLQSLFNLFFKKIQFFWFGYTRFRVHASPSHQIITRLLKENICHVLSYWWLHPSLSTHHTKQHNYFLIGISYLKWFENRLLEIIS